ncbi:MAG: DNA adenine methylase [Candidatus Bathyarchaeia archaeon]
MLIAPQTESIKYIGSKLTLLPYILDIIQDLNVKTVFDGFAGTTRVSQALAKSGYTVISNDIAIWSFIFGTCYLLNTKTREDYTALITHLNNVPPVDGWFTTNYGGYVNDGLAIQADGLKKPWQIHNTRKLDGIRHEITKLNLDPLDNAVALTSLMLALDKVDNTMGHFTSYLSKWSARSYKQLLLQIPHVFITNKSHTVYQQDIITLAPIINADLAYLDPPYGSNNEKMPSSRVRYSAYYHLWQTICACDTPEIFGKAKRRVDTKDCNSSVFEDYKKQDNGKFICLEALQRTIVQLRTEWVLLSYSSGGRATASDLSDMLYTHGDIVKILNINYKNNVMSYTQSTKKWLRETDTPNVEYLFLLHKR